MTNQAFKPSAKGCVTMARWALVAVLCLGGFLRASDAYQNPFEWIEVYEFIPASMTLSWDHHPVRVAQHGALPAYLIRTSTLLFGDSTLGARMLSVVAGTGTIVLLYLIGARWWGPLAGLTAAALLAVERYHISITRAIDLPFDLFFIALAMFCFSRFLYDAQAGAQSSPRASSWLYGAAVASAFGFLCKEFTALLVPVFLLSLLILQKWLWRREPWIAMGLFLLVIAPDLYSNLTVTRAQRMDLAARHSSALQQLGREMDEDAVENGLFMSYGDQLSRFRGVALNLEPFYFYFGDLFDRAGIPHRNEFNEFPYMSPLMSAPLWIAIAVGLARRAKDALTVFLLTMFVVMFFPFAFVELGPPRATFPTDRQALWYWADRTMLPALLVAGHLSALAMARFVFPTRYAGPASASSRSDRRGWRT